MSDDAEDTPTFLLASSLFGNMQGKRERRRPRPTRERRRRDPLPPSLTQVPDASTSTALWGDASGDSGDVNGDGGGMVVRRDSSASSTTSYQSSSRRQSAASQAAAEPPLVGG
jgi:hypothetical protein